MHRGRLGVANDTPILYFFGFRRDLPLIAPPVQASDTMPAAGSAEADDLKTIGIVGK